MFEKRCPHYPQLPLLYHIERGKFHMSQVFTLAALWRAAALVHCALAHRNGADGACDCTLTGDGGWMIYWLAPHS
jgi:hypothetical protein